MEVEILNTPESREKIERHYTDLLESINPASVNQAYVQARKNNDRAEALRLLATYFREKELPAIVRFGPGTYDRTLADNAVKGKVRVVSVDYTFPDAKFDFYYNPTNEHPPVNHEWLWQHNRFDWWPSLSRAYADTKDETYAQAFAYQLEKWVLQTDPSPDQYNGVGSAWRTIECGLRLMYSWQLAYTLFRKSPSVSDRALLLMVASMHKQALHLRAHPSGGGNWLMMETNGVYAFSSMFPEFADAADLRTWAGGLIVNQIIAQVLPDGFQFELSPDYHYVCFICAANVWEVASACNRLDELPPAFFDVVRRMADCYVAVSTPRLVQPRTNDCYTMGTSWVTAWAERMFPDDLTFAFINSKRTRGQAPAGQTASRFLPYAGFVAMRSDWSEEASYLCFDVGTLGMAHAHQDKLNVILYKGEEELVFDDGGGQYELSPARAYGLSAYDHNTVTVDGLAQVRKGPRKTDEPLDVGYQTNAVFDYAQATYTEGFGKDEECLATHNRQVRFCKPDFFVVRDTLESADGKPHRYEVRFHMDTVNSHEVDSIPGATLVTYGKNWDLLVVPVLDAGENENPPYAVSGQTEPCYLGWYIGRNESSNHPATTLLRSCEPTKTHHFTTLLIPVAAGAALPTVTTDAEKHTVTVQWNEKTYAVDLNALNQ